MHMIDVMNKLKEIAESGYDNEDIQRGIDAAATQKFDEESVMERDKQKKMKREDQKLDNDEQIEEEVVDEAEVAEEDAVEENAVEEVHEDVEEDTSLADMLKLAGRSGVMGLSENNIIAESLELDEEDEVEESEEVEEEAIDEAEVEETVEVPVSALSELMRLAGYEDYESKINEYENDPEVEYMDVEDQMIGLSGGLNGPKKAYAAAAGGDNAMAQEPTEVEESLEESFYKEYSQMIEELKDAD